MAQTPNLPEVTISLQGDDLVQSEPLFSDGKAYFSDVSGNVYSYDLESGRQLWRHSIGAAALSSPTLAGELLVVGGNDGALHALEVDTGEERWAYNVSGWVATKPAFASGFVVFGSDDGGVYSLNADSGSLEWSVQTGAAVRSSPVVNAGTVFVGSDDSHLYGLALDTGSITWRFRTNGSVRSTPTVSGGVLLFGSQDNYVYAIDVSSRRQVWRLDTGYAITSSPVVSSGAVIQGNARGDLFSLDMATGSVNWQVEAGGPITSTVAMSDGRLIVGTEHKSINGFAQNGGRLWEVSSRDAIIGGGVESEYGYCVGSHKSIICLQGGAESIAAPDPIESSNTGHERPLELSDCEGFRGDSTRFGYCRVQVAANTDLRLSADEICADSGDWQTACRQAWAVSRAENHQSGWGRDDLLAGCLDNADCIFEVLDHRRSEDLFEQLSLCHTLAREFSNDCAVHALDRWVHAQPSVEDIGRLNVLPYFRVHVGQYLAASEVCWGVGSCPLDEVGGAACLEKRTELRSNEQLCRGFR